MNMNANDESPTSASEDVLAELRDFCQSQALSEHALRQRLSSLDTQDDSSYYDVLFDICENEHVTPGILKCFIEYFPRAVRSVGSTGSTPLHTVLRNKNCTMDIVRCLTKLRWDILLLLLSRQDDEGRTPLFILCQNDELDEAEAVAILRFFVKKCPQCAQCTTRGGCTTNWSCSLQSLSRVLLRTRGCISRVHDSSCALRAIACSFISITRS